MRSLLCFLLLSVSVNVNLLAQEAPISPDTASLPLPISPEADPRLEHKMYLLLHWIGLEVQYGIPTQLLEDKDLVTTFWMGGLGAYKFHNRYRDPVTDGALGTGIDGNLTAFDRIQGQIRLGLAQRILPPVDVFALYQGEWNDYSTKDNAYLTLSDWHDRDSVFQNSFIFGLQSRQLPPRVHGIRQGYAWEASWETAPEALQMAAHGPISWYRFNVSGQYELPLFDLDPQLKENIFSGMLAFYGSADAIQGDNPSLMALQTFGGWWIRTGLGGSVRGVDTSRFDSNVKAVFNTELRVWGPSIYFHDLLVGALAYFDYGYHGEMPGLKAGNLFTTGVGLSFDFFGLGQIVLYEDLWINGKPILAPSFPNIRLGFGLHF